MICIKEQKAKHVPGITSLFITFDYQPEIVEVLKQCDVFSYDKKTTTWEIPITSLQFLLDRFCLLTTVELQLLEDKVEKPAKIYTLRSYKTSPFPYQKDAIQYGLNHDKWLLLDAPGLGKTLTAICLAEELKDRDHIEHCLIVCGINTLKTNWKKEIEKHSKYDARILGERVGVRSGKVTYGGTKERVDDLRTKIDEFFVIINVEALRNDSIMKELTKGINKFDMIVCDEVHAMKNSNSQQGKHFLKLKAKYQIGMTGTLLLNNPVDAYVPLKWIGMDNSAKSTFDYYYCKYGGAFHNEFLGYRNLTTLKDQLSKCSLRRTKDLLDLPPKTIINEFVDLDTQQRKFYDDIKQGIIDEVDKVHMSTVNLLAMVARLRQATACPSILTSSKVESAKITRTCDLVEQIVGGGDKVVVFSTFKQTVEELANKLRCYNPMICTGDVKEDVISSNIDRFQTDPTCKVMLATWQKMGTGITLTAASFAIFIDCAWTSGQNLQAEDRIYRIGSKDPVFIYYLWANDTIDMRVKELVDQKEAVAEYVVDDLISQKSIDSLRKYIEELR